jgi:rhodanese-related sulfurtransferase
VAELWAAVRDVASVHVAEVTVLADEYLGDRGDVERVSAAELAKRLCRGEVVVLDVRPEAEYLAGHIAGARSAPVDELSSRVDELSGQGEVVAYCRGPYCVYADDAVRIMRKRGVARAGWMLDSLNGSPLFPLLRPIPRSLARTRHASSLSVSRRSWAPRPPPSRHRSLRRDAPFPRLDDAPDQTDANGLRERAGELSRRVQSFRNRPHVRPASRPTPHPSRRSEAGRTARC